MKTIRVWRDETCTNRVTFEVDVPDDYQEMDVADFDDLVTDRVASLEALEEEVIDVIETTSWKEES